jgi:beta-glucosidase
MPWLDQASTLIHAWYGGQETGNALVDILFGKVNPSGRLSLTFPKRLEDTPAFLNFGKNDRKTFYGEGIFVGYRYYEKLDVRPLFYFGFGLSYTTFQYDNLIVPGTFDADPASSIEISVDITNAGDCDGAEVIQVYIADPESSIQRPHKEFKAFQKVELAKGEKKTCHITLDKYALSFWSEEFSQWQAEAGDFVVILAKSADPKDELLRKIFKLPKTFWWSGV